MFRRTFVSIACGLAAATIALPALASNYGTKLMLEAPTSNGKRWAERLNGVEAFTAHNMFAMIEHTRLEKAHGGYMTTKGKPFDKWYA